METAEEFLPAVESSWRIRRIGILKEVMGSARSRVWRPLARFTRGRFGCGDGLRAVDGLFWRPCCLPPILRPQFGFVGWVKLSVLAARNPSAAQRMHVTLFRQRVTWNCEPFTCTSLRSCKRRIGTAPDAACVQADDVGSLQQASSVTNGEHRQDVARVCGWGRRTRAPAQIAPKTFGMNPCDRSGYMNAR